MVACDDNQRQCISCPCSPETAFAIDGGVSSTESYRWLIDSGAIKHMTPDKSLVTEYQEFEQPEKVAIAYGNVNRFKAHLVAKGYAQKVRY